MQIQAKGDFFFFHFLKIKENKIKNKIKKMNTKKIIFRCGFEKARSPQLNEQYQQNQHQKKEQNSENMQKEKKKKSKKEAPSPGIEPGTPA